ncbi:antiviral reverse transcriptase Drt3b [Roseivivax sediminis]|uniref:Reverse transcriptase (RNA-dependent DNA polymerase) n=1 Tax=Roseivivax sediminis TaxID=936889 RepID=A0A1I2DZ44_9RHOB|nr:antiviral reverse transcriptase Drt3b [Roseivivax sediminis]SFE85677.1 Reverse transcriptase (RNA-dependent DNA polymerase) [Roseivivax sediminis]
MTNIDSKMKELRALLTETLPYELPFGFTNENFFLSELKIGDLSDAQRKKLDFVRRSRKGYTKPFSYKINRSHREKNTISIIHPTIQLRIAKLYSEFEQTILQSCARSPFSLRYPAASQRIFTKGSSKDVRRRWEADLPDDLPGQKISTPYVPSYFAYQRFLLLDRFFSSNELVRLESRFSRLRTLDVSRCFFNIYTHSISWAVKEKDFSKDNSKMYSFEQQFDEVMQYANYNETAGLLVGPEASRIFAEIILQRIDLEVAASAEQTGLREGRDYTVRRYVDDFHIFADEEGTLDKIERFLSDSLEEYKMFLNLDKARDFERPFVTSVSRVKFEVHGVARRIEECLIKRPQADDEPRKQTKKAIRSSLDALRHIGGSERAAMVSSTSEIYGALHSSIAKMSEFAKEDLSEDEWIDLSERAKFLVRMLYYLLSLDFRVPPLIRSAEILRKLSELLTRAPEAMSHDIRSYVIFETDQLISSNYDSHGSNLPLEIANAFLIGLLIDPGLFVSQAGAKLVLSDILEEKKTCYFSMLCLLHAHGSAGSVEAGEFAIAIRNRVLSDEFDIHKSCEDHLIFCDFVSCPYVDFDLRWTTFNDVTGGVEIGKEEFDKICPHLRFVNWQETGIQFAILQKRLPPVYFSS